MSCSSIAREEIANAQNLKDELSGAVDSLQETDARSLALNCDR
jgi:hypothetical protein